jgi:hypothetical protein
MHKFSILFLMAIMIVFPNCTRHRIEVAPVEIKPIHITIDVNVKIDRALDDFFGDIDKEAETLVETPASGK